MFFQHKHDPPRINCSGLAKTRLTHNMEHCVYFVTLSAYVVREEKGNMIFYELCFHIPDSLAKIELSPC
ncbi:hypothetical protein A3863_20260 [Priestia endophytica]|nr:hypothetical protein A3863_20260 [Priestia endophytica]